MKLSFNILRPLIFFFCGLGYLPLQSADTGMSKDFASKNIKIEKEISKLSSEDRSKGNMNQVPKRP